MKIDLVAEEVVGSGHRFIRVVAWLEKLPIHERQEDSGSINDALLNTIKYLVSFGIDSAYIDTWIEQEELKTVRTRIPYSPEDL